MHFRKEKGREMATRAIGPGDVSQNIHWQSDSDLPNEFYSLLLGGSMSPSCGYFTAPDNDLETAQAQMLHYICGKLRVQEGERVLDLGCGWGAWMLHAAKRYRARVFGTTSELQHAEFATDQFRFFGVADRCLVDVSDYYDLDPPTEYDKIVSLDTFENTHPGQLLEYFQRTFSFLMPGGVFLTSALVSLAAGHNSPAWELEQRLLHDAELPSLDTVLGEAESTGFEIRDVENLREHYALTLTHWLGNLERNAERGRQIAGDTIHFAWRTNLAESVHAVRAGRMGFYHVLLSKPKRGSSGSPLTRRDWYR
jgi:cyclopropane-fatty-acyl-phospholipid synthase